MGVPLPASRVRTWKRPPSTARISTSCNPDRVGPIGRPGAEHAPFGDGGIVPGMDGEYVPPGQVKPGQDDDLVADAQVPQARPDRRFDTSSAWGEPSSPCFGAAPGSVEEDSTHPIGTAS